MRTIVVDGQEISMANAARSHGLTVSSLYARLYRGWSVERALATGLSHSRMPHHRMRKPADRAVGADRREDTAEAWKCTAPTCCACDSCKAGRARSRPRTPDQRWSRIRAEWAARRNGKVTGRSADPYAEWIAVLAARYQGGR